MVTKKSFEEGFAQRSRVTVQWLKEQGREARPCDCGEEGCEGWQKAYIRPESTGTMFYCQGCKDWYIHRHIHCPHCGEKIELEGEYQEEGK